MRLIGALFVFCSKHNVNLLMQHVPVRNNIADILSRLQVDKFRCLRPDGDAEPVRASPVILNC